MALQLILGPSGAHKVGRLLDAHEAASREGKTAWFVVPTSAGVERFQQELAGLQAPPGQSLRTGTPFGLVMAAARLEGELLARFGAGQQLLSGDHRRAVALAAIHGTELTALQPAARSGWLADELTGLADELTATGDLGAAAEAGLESWSARSSDSRGDELAALLRADAAILARLASSETDRHVSRATAAAIVAEALRVTPSAANDLHVVLAGFDDLDPVQRALVLALARSGAQVLVALPYEEGREALAAAKPLVEALAAVADGAQTPEVAAPSSPLERVSARLYEHAVYVAPEPAADPDPDFSPFSDARLGPLVDYDAVDRPSSEFASSPSPADGGDEAAGGAGPQTDDGTQLGTLGTPFLELRGGGPDEEAALIAEHVAAHLEAGCPPDSVVVVVGQPAAQGPVLEAALRRAGVPAHLVARRPSRVWPSIAAVVALLRAVGEGGEPRHLVDWVAGPGGPGTADAFDAAVRRRGATGFWDALGVWASLGNARMQEVDDLRAAARRRERDQVAADPRGDDQLGGSTSAEPGAESLEAVVARILRARLAAAMSQMGMPTPEQERDLRAVGRVLRILDELVALGRSAPDLGLGLRQLAELIEAAPSPLDREPVGSVAVVGPLDVRTRYPEVVIVARAGRSSYPAAEPIRRVLTRSDRAALREHHGWPAPARADHAASERYLAYEVVSRPSRQLVLAWHSGNGDGKPAEPSPLIAEVRRVAGEPVPEVFLASGAASRHAASAERITRLLEARGGARHREPTPLQAPLLAAQPRDRYAVRELQTASRCTAQWFVDHHLRPRPLSPDSAPLTAGRLRHEILAEVVGTVVTGGEPLGPSAVPALRQALAAAADRLAARDAAHETQAERLMRERVVAEVDATIPGLCGEGVLAHQPEAFELPFGTGVTPSTDDGRDEPAAPGADEPDDARPPVVVERAGERLVLAGRIDRLDRSERTGELVVVDYKGANVDQYRSGGWVEGRELQAGLYALAAEQLAGEGSRAVASLYQPVPGPAGQPARGATSTDLPGRGALSRNDQLSSDDWDELLDELVRLAGEAQRRIDDGIVAPDPLRCSAGGCRYPWLCREVQA